MVSMARRKSRAEQREAGKVCDLSCRCRGSETRSVVYCWECAGGEDGGGSGGSGKRS